MVMVVQILMLTLMVLVMVLAIMLALFQLLLCAAYDGLQCCLRSCDCG
jgi:hypothetical protein